MNASNPFPSPIGVDGYQNIFGSCSDSATLSVVSGNLVISSSIVDVPTVGVGLKFFVTYNSQDHGPVGTMGYRWRHCWMMKLIGIGTSVVTFVSEDGRQYNFIPTGGGNWSLDTDSSYFMPGNLTNPATNVWKLSIYPDGGYYQFDDNGLLVQVVDTHGNAIALTYSGGLLTTITEPTARTIQLSHTGGLLRTVTDPNSNVYSFYYDASSNLTEIVSPTGCLVTYGYAVPSAHLVTTRSDAYSESYVFGYDGSERVVSITGPEFSSSLTYVYDTPSELAGHGVAVPIQRTRLTDTRGNPWEYHFDPAGNLWRIIDPIGHWRRFYWTQEQKLLYATAGFPQMEDIFPGTVGGPYDNIFNSFSRSVYDSKGNLLCTADPTGSLDHYVYDSNQRLTSVFSGQGHLGVQGNWSSQFGKDGYLLCAWNPDNSDVPSSLNPAASPLPSYVTSVTKTGVTAQNYNNAVVLIDPRAPVYPSASKDNPKRGAGLWYNQGSTSAPGTFTVTVNVADARSFDLSVYSHALNQSSGTVVGPYYTGTLPGGSNYYAPLSSSGLFGCYLRYQVTDANGTQEFTVYNNAPGAWVTFPVKTTTGHTTVTVTVSAIYNPGGDGNGTIQAQIAALAFDSYQSRQTSYGYNTVGDLTSVIDSLGHGISMTYNSDGTMSSSTDIRGGLTQYFYEDTHKNLTRVVDPLLATWLMTYDNNGNLLSVTNPNSHVTSMAYDGKNRLVSTTSALGYVTHMVYDLNGNLIRMEDPLGRVTQLFYSPNNRLARIVDAMLGETQFSYDSAGNLVSVQDPRGNTASFLYDVANRLTQVTQPDAQLVKLALDALDRVRAITTPNGNQSALSSINVTNGANLVRNPGAEQADPYFTSQARYWKNSIGSSNRDNTHSHSGSYSLPSSLSASQSQSWQQDNLALAAGGRYLANVWVQKSADGVAANLSLTAEVYDLVHAAQSLAGPATTVSGSSSNWQQLNAPFRFDVPGDGQSTRFTTTRFLATITNQSSTAATQAWLDDFSLTPLSTTYCYDAAGRMEEVRTPDGARWRLYRDRFSRVVGVEDPNGLRTSMTYDALDRLTSVTDPMGDQSQFSYDNASNLTLFQDALGNQTHYAYEARGLLSQITYPDATTEKFEYDGDSNLTAYTDNQNRRRTFHYDNDERLTSVVYSDSSTLSFTYDGASNILTRTERNGDITTFRYDALDRMNSEIRLAAGGSGNPNWDHAQAFDANGNRTKFYIDPPRYGVAHYGTARYASPTWSVLSPGYDSMNRMPGYQDGLGHQTGFAYDVEGRRTGISFPFNVNTGATYDITGRLLGLATTHSSTNLLSLQYGYDQASNRVGMVAGSDTFDYQMDSANRLVSVSLNRLVDQLAENFVQGRCAGTEVDASTPAVKLLAFNDHFSGNKIDSDRWRLAYRNIEVSTGQLVDFLGFEVRQDEGLLMGFPHGYTDNNALPTLKGWADPYGIYDRVVQATAELRRQVSGDFDIQVDFDEFNGAGHGSTGLFAMGLLLNVTPFEESQADQIYIVRQTSGPDALTHKYVAGIGNVIEGQNVITTDLNSGKVRIQRVSATNVLTFSYYNAGSWTTLWTGTFASANSLYVNLYLGSSAGVGSGRFTNFTVSVPTAQYPTSGTYTSPVYDAGRAPTWGTLSWAATTPSGTAVKFQLASSNSPSGPWTFLGPTGAASYYTTSGTAIPSTGSGAITGRYFQYQATLTGAGTSTPVLTRVVATFAGTNSSSLMSMVYDACGNITSLSRETASGTATEVRDNASWSATDRINSLNQIKRNDVTPVGGPTTTYRYTYNADGTTASKTDGTTTWSYTWDSVGEQRLLDYRINGVVQVSFTYDSMGRMLTRTPYTSGVAGTATTFEWDGWDMIREVTPAGTYRYYAPQGEILTFDFTTAGGSPVTSTYSVIADAIGSVRAITDSSGAVVAHYEYSAWGELLPSSSPLSIGFSYLFVGSLGVRWDATLGMHYMRQRWYDASLQRFLSRDPLGSANRYVYAANRPSDFIDPMGLKPFFGANPEDRYPITPGPYARILPSGHPVWNSKYRDALHNEAAPDTINFYKPTTVTGAWKTMTAGHTTDCGQKCFLICTGNVADSNVKTNFRHAFLVFGSRERDVYGLFQGEIPFKSPISINSWNHLWFKEPGQYNVQCRRVCMSSGSVDKARRIADAGVPGGRYIAGESNVWVYQVLEMAGYHWTGYDLWFPTP